MKLKKRMKIILPTLAAVVAFYSLPSNLITSTQTYRNLPSLFNLEYALTNSMVTQLINENESFMSSHHLKGMLDNFHDDFKMQIVHATDREETLNKSQYQKHFEFISLFGMDYSLKSKVVSLNRISKSRVLVTLIIDQSFTHEKLSILDHENTNIQTMLIVNDDGSPKILEVTSSVRSNQLI